MTTPLISGLGGGGYRPPGINLSRQSNGRQWLTALGSRRSRRANIAYIGASVTEGIGASAFTNTMPAKLAENLRTMYPTSGVTGGRGLLPIPGNWPLYTLAGGTTQLLQNSGGPNHASVIFFAAGDKVTVTVTGTSFDLLFVKGPAGTATAMYYKIDAGAVVPVNTNNGTQTYGNRLNVVLGGGTHTVEIGFNTAVCVCEGVIEYNGDENAGIQVHNLGIGAQLLSIWNANSPNLVAESIARALDPDLLCLQMVTGDHFTAAGVSVSAAMTGLQTMIATLRTGGVDAPIVLDFTYTCTTVGEVAPWIQYVNAMKVLAANNATIFGWIDHSARMPDPNPAVPGDKYGLYFADNIHCDNDGYAMMADTIASQIQVL